MMNMMNRSSLLAPLLALVLASPATQALASPEKAAALQTLVTRHLSAAAADRDGLHVERVPDVQVTHAGDSYQVRIPKLRVAAGSGWMAEAPLVEGEARPQPDGSWRIKTHLPQPLTVYGGNGFRLGDVSLGRQSLSLHLSGDGRSLLAADLDLGNARFIPAMGAGTGSLTALRLILTPQAITGGKWSGKLSLAIDGLAMKDPMGVDRLSLRRLRLDGTADGLDMARLGELVASGRRTDLDRIASKADLAAEIADFRFIGDDGTRTALAGGKGSLSLTGLMGNRVSAVLDWRHDGLERVGGSVPPGLLPARADLALTAHSLPPAVLFSPRPPGGWTPALAAAGSKVTVSRLHLWNPQSTIIGQGDFRFAAAHANSVSGEGNLSLRGVDRIIGDVNRMMGARGAGIAIALYALQGLGRVQPGPDDTTHQYNLVITPDGRVTLNGSDATGLFRGLMALN
ncbi:hypothetical protein [Niveispirillum fermenti]|uniref:hypothetical protein n=1 Tax=Niveispirillum fermenti TaxID=1233113 RepID=UPI003A88A99D